MILTQVFERFVKDSPVSIMVRVLLEKILSPQKLDELFERSSQTQYTRELLFSTIVSFLARPEINFWVNSPNPRLETRIFIFNINHLEMV